MAWDDLARFNGVTQKTEDVVISENAIRIREELLDRASLRTSMWLNLHFSRSEQAIALEFSETQTGPWSLPLRQIGGRSGHVVARGMAAFFNQFLLIASSWTGRFQATQVDIPRVGARWVVYMSEKISE